MEEQAFENKERTVYLSSTGDFVKTDLTNPREIKYASEIQLANKSRDKFFGLKPLEQDRTEITKAAMEAHRGIFKQAGAGAGAGIVSMGQELWNWAKYTNANLFNKARRKLNEYSADILKSTGAIEEQARDNMMTQVNNDYKNVRDIINTELLANREKQIAYLEKTGLAKKEGDSLIYDIANGGVSVLASLGLAVVTKSPSAAALMFGGVAGQSGYEEALAAGIEPEKALKVGVARGFVESSLERIGLHVYIEGLKARGIFTRIAKNALIEGVQEASQQTAEEILQTKYGGRAEDWRRATNDILMSAFVGILVGGGFASVGAGAEALTKEKAGKKDTGERPLPVQNPEIDLTDVFLSGVKRYTDMGMPPEDARDLTFSLIQKAGAPESAKEIVDMIKEENSNLTYINNDENQNAAAVAEAIKQATAPERVVKQQAFNIADKVEEDLIKAGRAPEEAAADAKIAQAGSIGLYNLTGVLPQDQIKIDIALEQSENENGLTGEEDTSFDFGFNDENNTPITPKYDYQVSAGEKAGFTQEQREYIADTIINNIRGSLFSNFRPRKKVIEERNKVKEWWIDNKTGKTSTEPETAAEKYKDDDKEIITINIPNRKAVLKVRKDAMAIRFLLKDLGINITPKKEFASDRMYQEGIKYDENGKADINTPEFKNWFGNSKVVDENGEPLVVYHGGIKGIDSFSKSYEDTPMFFFTDDEYLAETYRDRNTSYEKSELYPVYLSIKNPLNLTFDNEQLKQTIKQISEEAYKKYDIEETDETIQGKHNIASVLISYRNEIAKYARDNGYDGLITYEEQPNGHFGGIGYIAFEPTQIKSVYNKGTFDAKNPNIFYQEGKGQDQPVDLTDVFSDIAKLPKSERQSKLENALNDLIGKEFPTATEPLRVQITSENKPHIIGTNLNLSAGQEKRHLSALKSLEQIIRNAIKIDKDGSVDLTHNTNKKTLEHKKNVLQYVYFESPIKIGDDTFAAELSTEQVRGQEENLLDLYHIRVKRKSHPAAQLSTLQGGSYVNSITDKDGKVKTQKLNQGNIVPRGSVTFADDIKQAFVRFNETTDKSTLVHELGHIWLKNIEKFADYAKNPEFAEFKQNLDAWLGAPVNGVYTVEQQEKFAKTFERYLQEGKAPNAELQSIFDRFKEWLTEIYNAIKDYIELTPEAIKTFDTLLAPEKSKYNIDKIKSKTAQAKAVVEKIKQGKAVSIDGVSVQDIKEALKVMNSRIPAEPKDNLLRTLRREGADYANAARIDKEQYKNARVPNKKDGIQDGLALTLRDWGYMDFDDSAVADYEGLSEQDEKAADLIDRALGGEKIYKIGDPQAIKREEFLADVERAREVLGENGEEVARAINTLEKKGYRVVEKADIAYLEKQLEQLDKVVEKARILEQNTEEQKKTEAFEKMQKQNALEARRIKTATLEELNKRDIAGKEKMFEDLQKAETPEEIFTAAADILTELEKEFAKTEEGQAEQRKIDVPATNWEAKKVTLLKDIAEISANATKEERAARNMIEQARQARHGARAALSKKELAEYEKAKSFLSKSFEKKYLKAFNNALRGEPHIEGKDVASIMRVMANNAMEMRLISDHIVKQFISIAQRKQTANYKKYLSGKISALLNNKIFAKVGQLRRAKFTPEIMEFMKHAKEIWGLTNKDAEKEYDFRAKSYDPENPPSPVQAFENRLLEFKVLWDTQDPADAKGLYDELLDLLRGDRQLKRFEEVKKQFNESGRRLILTQALKEKKLPVGTKAYLLHAGTDLQSALDVLFGKFEYETMGYDGKMHKEIFNARAEFAGELDQIEEQNFLHHYNMALDESVRSAYGLDTKFQMFDKIKELLDYKKEVINYGFIKDTENGAMIASIFRNGKWVDNNNPRKQTLNKLNIIYDYIQSQNHEYVETAEGIKDVGYAARLERSYGKEQLNDMFACLTDQDRKLADSLIELASKFYPELNKVHKRIYGFAMPKNEGVYFPGVTERIADDVDWHADFAANSKAPYFIKERVKSNKPVMALVNPLAVLKAHGRRSAEFIYNAERFTELKRLFKAEEMETAFVDKFGQKDGIELYQKMLRLIDLQGPQKQKTKGEFFKVSDKIFNNWVKTAMGLKIMTGIKQVASGISFAEKMPANTYAKYFAEAVKHPVQTMDYMDKSFPYIETRFQTGGLNEAVARAMASNDISAMGEKFNMITNLGLLNTRYGDRISISIFGYPYYKYLREDLNLPEAEAKAEFLRQATTTLQSSLKSQLSEAQSVADNFATRVFMVFRNQQLQYVRKAFTTYAQYKNGEISAKQFAKAEFIYLVLNPLVYVALGLGFIPRDDEDKKRLAFAPITQTMGAYPFGEATAELLVDNIYSAFKEKKLTAPQKMGLPMIDDIVKDITRAVKSVNEDDLTAEDYIDATLGIAKYSGLPLNTFKSMIKGGRDIAGGKPAKGALEIIGYTERRAGKIAGDDETKKKRKKRKRSKRK